jgi:hypothetical protein
MPRPCCNDHNFNPANCRICAWCLDKTPKGEAYRKLWNEKIKIEKPKLPKGTPHCITCVEKKKQKANNMQEINSTMSPQEVASIIKKRSPGNWPNDWAKWDNVRDAFIILMKQEIEKDPRPMPGIGTGTRGIVVSVSAKPGFSSGKNLPHGYFPGAYVLVKELRRLGCKLPITFAHLGALEWDINLTRLMKPYDVNVIDLREIEKNDNRRPRILAGWESKVYASIHAPYEQILYLDADINPIVDPTYILDSSQFKQVKAIFWPDVPPYDRAEWLPECVWKNVGLDYRDEVDFESGQFAIDKKARQKELSLTMFFNEYSDYYYQFVFGDKSTYHLAWSVLGTHYAIPRHGPGGNDASLYQYDFSNNLLFQHLTRNKPSLSGYPSPGSVLKRDECEKHLQELNNKWNGKLWHQIEPTEIETQWKKQLEGMIFLYERKGLGIREIRFLEDNRIGRGADKCEFSWNIWEKDKKPFLVISSIEGKPTFTAIPENNNFNSIFDINNWAGKWLEYEQCEITLKRKEIT